MNNKQIERRVRFLERLILERSVGRGGPSIAMNIWQFLMDHGPATRDEIDSALGSRYSNTTALNSWVKPGLITKRGDRYIANPNYVWDDVGVIQRDIPRDLLHLQDSEIANLEPTESGDNKSTTGRTRKPKQQPVVTPNMFSNNLAEVKAAVDAGENVNQLNDKGMPAVIKAITSKAGTSEEIAIYLIEHGADLTYTYKGRDALSYAIRNNKYKTVQAIIDSGYNLFSLLKLIEALENDWPISKLDMFVTDHSVREAFQGLVYRCIIYINSACLSNSSTSESDMQNLADLIVDKLFKHKQIDQVESAIKNDHITPFIMALHRATVKHGWLPFIRKSCTASFTRELNAYSSYIKELCSMAKMYIDGKLKSSKSCLLAWIDLLDAIKNIEPNKEKLFNEFLSSIANQDSINSLGDKVWDVFADMIENNLDSAKQLSKFKFTPINSSSVSAAFFPFVVNDVLTNLPKDAVRLLCSKIRRSIKMPIESIISRSYLSSLSGIDDEYVLNFLIDIGLGPSLADQYLHGMSKTCKEVLLDAGFLTRNQQGFIDNKKSTTSNSDRFRLVNDIVRSIEEDTMNAELRRKILSDTSLLFEPVVVETIEDHPDSATGRQLKRIADENKPEKDIYDF